MHQDSHDIVVAKILAHWATSRAKTVSIDASTFSNLFFYLPVLHTVHDRETKEPILLIVDRLTAIRLVKEDNNMKDGEECRIHLSN